MLLTQLSTGVGQAVDLRRYDLAIVCSEILKRGVGYGRASDCWGRCCREVGL